MWWNESLSRSLTFTQTTRLITISYFLAGTRALPAQAQMGEHDDPRGRLAIPGVEVCEHDGGSRRFAKVTG
jgi:hypothetical protein